MHRPKITIYFVLLGLIVGGLTFAWALEERERPASKEEQTLMKQAKLTLEEAKKIALKEAPGKVFDWELEKEDGKLVYAIEIQLPDDKKYSREVVIDAITGKVVEVEKENLPDNLKKAIKDTEDEDKDEANENEDDDD